MSRRQRGFTLFETLVAMTLMVMLLGALMPVFQGGLQTLRYGASQTRAALLAQALLKRALVEQNGEQLLPPASGETAGLRWRIQRQPYQESELTVAADNPQPGSPLWEISARVEWDSDHAVVLRGLAPAASPVTKPGSS